MRLKTAKEFAAKVEMEIRTDENYMLRDFLQRALLAERLPNGRCRMCYTAFGRSGALCERERLRGIYEHAFLQHSSAA